MFQIIIFFIYIFFSDHIYVWHLKIYLITLWYIIWGDMIKNQDVQSYSS